MTDSILGTFYCGPVLVLKLDIRDLLKDVNFCSLH